MLARLAIIAIVALAACYDVPRPECGFRCGPNGECPSGYTCFSDQLGNVCKRSSPPFLGDCEVFIPPDAPDVDPPMFVSAMPAPDSVDVPAGSTILVTFSEPVEVFADNFVVTTGGVPVDGARFNGMTARFEPFQSFQQGTTYTVELTAGIRDLSGNPLLGAPISWSFTTGFDTTPPQFEGTLPGDGTIGVGVANFVEIAFSEAVNIPLGAFGVELGGTPLPGSLMIAGGPANWRFDPRDQLLPNTVYTIRWTGAIADNAGNPATPGTAMFTTGADTVRPNIIARMPMPSAVQVSVGTLVTVTFDEVVTGLDDMTLTLSGPGGQIPATVTFDAPTRRATLTPLRQLDPNAAHSVVLSPDVADTSGNPYDTIPTLWMFTTGADTIAPRVVSTAPADDATDVPVDATISVTFDEEVTNLTETTFVVMGAGTGTLAPDLTGRTWTFTPDAPLPASTPITVMLTTGIQDTDANALVVPVMFDFTTAP